MKTLDKILLPLIIFLNLIHLILPVGDKLNDKYSPAFSVIALFICLFCFKFFSDLKKDYRFIFSLVVSVITQNISNKVNGGVPDYINFLIFTSNIPDIIMFLTILTWWYYRVYKHPKINPAKI